MKTKILPHTDRCTGFQARLMPGTWLHSVLGADPNLGAMDDAMKAVEKLGSGTKRQLKRCPWSLDVSDAYLTYHDREWGVPARDDLTQFEFLTLESAQAGLSWSTVLHKREGYRKAFADFDPVKVSRFTDKRLEKLVLNPAIIRNRLKISAAISNAHAFLEVQSEFGSFCNYIWGFVDGKPVQNRWRTQKQVPATSPISDALSKDLKKRGFKFVGSTIIYAHMQATGMVNDHVTSCYRYTECRAMA